MLFTRIVCSVLLLIFSISVSGCYFTFNDAYNVASITQSIKPLKQELEKAIEDLQRIQDEKHLFDEVDMSTLVLSQSKIYAVLDRLDAHSFKTDNLVTVSELRMLWDTVVDAYNSANGVIRSKWDKLPEDAKVKLKAFDLHAKAFNASMEAALADNRVDKAEKMVKIITQVASLAIKVMGVL